jgi:DNA repair protein RadC
MHTRRQALASRSDQELLATLLQRGPHSTVELADRLLACFGGLRQLLMASPAELCLIKGVTEKRLQLLQALPEIAKRFYEQSLPAGQAIRSPADTEGFLRARLRDLPHELFCCLFLDNRHRVLAFEEMFTRRLRSALELVDIRLLDHLVIGDGKSVSLASRGAL